MWYITGDSAYKDNALKILRAWYTSLRKVTDAEGYDWSADVLSAGMSTNKFSFAAEILRYTPARAGQRQIQQDLHDILRICGRCITVTSSL